MFDLPPPSAEAHSAEAAEAALAAAEAALAAEIASTIEADGVAGDAPDSRTDPRVEVAWPARMQLPDGHVIELGVRNVSELGVGLMSDEHIPADTVVRFEMDVPPLGEVSNMTFVKGTIKTTYAVARGSKIVCGAAWEAPPDGLRLLKAWIRELQR